LFRLRLSIVTPDLLLASTRLLVTAATDNGFAATAVFIPC
jgi:hypothetical protein